METRKLDVNFINPFIDGTLETLKVQSSIEAKSEAPFLKGKGPTYQVDIAAVIGLVSSVFSGSIAICFSEGIFLKIMEGILGEPCPKFTKELEDGAAEMLNVIFGTAKKVLNEKGYGIQKAIPTIFTGGDIKVKYAVATTALVIPFVTLHGRFYIEIMIHE